MRAGGVQFYGFPELEKRFPATYGDAITVGYVHCFECPVFFV